MTTRETTSLLLLACVNLAFTLWVHHYVYARNVAAGWLGSATGLAVAAYLVLRGFRDA